MVTPDFLEGFFYGIAAVVVMGVLSWLHVRAHNARVEARKCCREMLRETMDDLWEEQH